MINKLFIILARLFGNISIRLYEKAMTTVMSNASIAEGDVLDLYASQVGLVRNFGETDKDFRARIIASILEVIEDEDS